MAEIVWDDEQKSTNEIVWDDEKGSAVPEANKGTPTLGQYLFGPTTTKEYLSGRVEDVKGLFNPDTWKRVGQELTQPLPPITPENIGKLTNPSEESVKGMANVVLSTIPVTPFSKAARTGLIKPHKTGAEAIKEAGLIEAGKAGYRVPRSTIDPTSKMVNLGERFGGKEAIRQTAEISNQKVSNKLASKALSETTIGKMMGITDDVPLTPELLDDFSKEAGKVYEAVKNIGVIKPDNAYFQGLDDISAKYTRAGKSFPQAAKNEVKDLVESLKVKEFDSASALDMVSILRESAKKAFRTGDSGLGWANRKAADEIEKAIDRALTNANAPQNLIANFRDARKSLAIAHSIEDALNPSTGNIAAPALAQMQKRGVPVSGALKQIADFSRGNRLVSREPTGAPPSGGSLEPLAYAMFGKVSGADGGVGLLAGGIPIIGKPIIRPLMTTVPYKNAMNMNPVMDRYLSQRLGLGAGLAGKNALLEE